MMKKFLAGFGTAALVLASATPAFATIGRPPRPTPTPTPSPKITNVATVTAGSLALSNTGLNTQRTGTTVAVTGGSVDKSTVTTANSMTTGIASGLSQTTVDANNSSCGCAKVGDVTNVATVKTLSVGVANTGLNSQMVGTTVTTSGAPKTFGFPSFGSTGISSSTVQTSNGMTTGNAGSESSAWVVVNSSVTPQP